MEYLKNSIKTYVNSFKEKNILLVSVLNALFIIVTAVIIKIISIISKPWAEKINNVDLSNIALQSEAELQNIVSTLKGFAIFAILTAIIFLLLLILNWSFFQGMIYHILVKRKINLKYFEKFLLVNIIWFIPWLIIFFIILFGAKINYLSASIYALILAFLHSSFVLYTIFIKEGKLKKLTHLKVSIKLHHFVIPYTLIAITFIIISQLNLLNPHIIVIALVYILFFSWLQNYTKEIILKIKA